MTQLERKVPRMKLEGPERYELFFDSAAYRVRCASGFPRFSGIASSRRQKLYVLSDNGGPFYVGATTQPVADRLRYGWKARGTNGYHGYAWRHALLNARLDVWGLDDCADARRDAETIEAEVVFLIRRAGQWPAYQTEIHFHASRPCHRQMAAQIAGTYGLPGAE